MKILSNDIIQFKIILSDTEPCVWRRILINRKTTFFELHSAIQLAMGWSNLHLYEFKINEELIGETEDFDDPNGFRDKLTQHAKNATLNEFIKESNEQFEYLYDFGDYWSHQVIVEKFLPVDKRRNYPTCIDGELNCPPENCGGIPAYDKLVTAMEDKEHPERKKWIDWLEEEYDFKYFDKNRANEDLKYMEKYIKFILENL